jgi:hypothetical protein
MADDRKMGTGRCSPPGWGLTICDTLSMPAAAKKIAAAAAAESGY